MKDDETTSRHSPKRRNSNGTPMPLIRGVETGELRTEERHFRTILEYARDGIFITTGNGRHVYANQTASHITGYSVDELCRMGIRELVPSEDFSELMEKYRKRIKGERIRTPYEAPVIHKNGRRLVVQVHGIRTVWEGRPADLVIFRDITQRREVEEQLNQREVTFRQISENLPGAIFQVVLRKDGSFVFPYMSASFRRVYDYRAEAIEKDSDLMFRMVPREDLSRNRKIILESARTLETYEMEHRIRVPDGTVRWVNVRGTPQRLENGETLWNAVAIDITRMKAAEQALKIAGRELEKRVKERTRELNEKNRELNEVNSALRVLIREIDRDRAELERKITSNVNELLLPYLEKLARSNLGENQHKILTLIKSNLGNIMMPFTRRLSARQLHLTPAQIQVAHMITQGKNSKEIAELLGISLKTVESHRKRLRKKLDLQNKKINLRTFLLSLAEQPAINREFPRT